MHILAFIETCKQARSRHGAKRETMLAQAITGGVG